MTRLRSGGLSLLSVLLVSSPVFAQSDHRIWGRVHTSSGDVHEGFIRWDRNEGSWVDVLDGSKTVPPENYQVWLAATDRERAVRAVDVLGYRVTWNEEDPDFRSLVTSGVRFGHLASLTVAGPDRIDVRLRSGQSVELSGGSTDIGRSMRELTVVGPDQREVELDWRDLERVEFSAVPAGAVAPSQRLFGTVEDVGGSTFTGFISWDLDEILESDVLDGEDIDGGDERDIRFAEIETIERIEDGARVARHDGQVLELTGSNDVDRGHRGVQISDPALGMVEVEWPEFRSIRFHRPDESLGGAGYETFAGGRALLGTVETQTGEVVEGMIRWDADEEASWELLNGRSDNVVFAIELAFVARIDRDPAFGAQVTLLDGRTFHLDESNDVDWDNKGIMVAPEGTRIQRASSWRLISWEDFRSVEFRAGPGRVEGAPR